MSDNALHLAGVKVVELSTFIAASTTGRFFANMGADGYQGRIRQRRPRTQRSCWRG